MDTHVSHMREYILREMIYILVIEVANQIDYSRDGYDAFSVYSDVESNPYE